MYYLDNAATTPLTDKVKNKIIQILDEYGNPSSVYELGKRTKRIIEDTREYIRKFIHAPANSEIIFTSSGSAANCLAIEGLIKNSEDSILLYSPTAHKSMLYCCKNYKYSHQLSVTKEGFIDKERLKHQLETYYPQNIIVCFEAANSEIGTIQSLHELIQLIHSYHGVVVIDFTGYIPYFEVNVLDLDVDIATFSGHKLHALKGIGVLYKIEDIGIQPIIYGSQENGYFAGTENVVGIASLGEAVKNYSYKYATNYQRDCLWGMLKENITDIYLIGTNNEYKRLPFNLFICFKGIDGNSLVGMLEQRGILVSTGSACNNGSAIPSNTLTAIGIDENDIHSCIRITFSGKENYLDLEHICKEIKDCVEFLRL